MPTLLFATNNENKIREIQAVVGDHLKICGLKDAGIFIDIPEPHHTLEENASAKSSALFALTAMSCFSEDSGLEVKALNGSPGVRSKRYAGENASDDENIDKLLMELRGICDRTARFHTVISLLWQGTEHLFHGTCEGKISEERRGSGGFGYDPVFIPDRGDRSFGEMTMEEKNRFSHRKKATEELVRFLQQQTGITALD